MNSQTSVIVSLDLNMSLFTIHPEYIALGIFRFKPTNKGHLNFFICGPRQQQNGDLGPYIQSVFTRPVTALGRNETF